MSSETAISTIETVKKKLEKYDTMKQDDKVNEYLGKLQNTMITPALIRETKIDILINRLASNNKASYYSTAQSLLKKWKQKNLLSNTVTSSKDRTVTNTNKLSSDKKFSVKRKSDNDRTHVHQPSESQSSDELRNNDRDQSSSTKKRRVLSLAEYVGSKKPTVNASTNADSTDGKLTDSQIKEIYAQFDAKYEELAASAPNLATNVDKKLKQTNQNRTDVITNGHISNTPIIEPPKTKYNDIWAEEEDDDDDNNNAIIDHPKQEMIKQIQPIKSKQTVKYNHLDTEQLKVPSLTSKIKDEKNSMTAAIASTLTTFDYSIEPSKPLKARPVPITKQSNEFSNFLRSKHGRQAIYSGRRARTFIPSLQDLCVEALKEHIDDICHTHFCRLPYEIVKPIIDVATPEQLHAIIDSNPDYADDVEPLWQHFCTLHFKEAKREENETYYELYLRKYNENEERLQRITDLAKRKKAETVDTARHTKTLSLRTTTSRNSSGSSKITRQVVNLPPSKAQRGQTKAKKPIIPPLLKKTLKAYNGKS